MDRGDGQYRSLVLEGPELHGKTLWALGPTYTQPQLPLGGLGASELLRIPKAWRKPSKLRAELGPGQGSCQLASKGQVWNS